MDRVTDPVDWAVAERVAGAVLHRIQPLDELTARRLEEDFAEATTRASELVERATGLRTDAGAARARVTDRMGWVRANIGSFQRLLRPLGERLAHGEGQRNRTVGATARAFGGAEVGLVLAWMSGRVLGQYDLLPVDVDDKGDVVYYVGPNVVSLERRHAFPPGEFRLWIALHEVTHRIQFTGVPWMREYFLGLVERGTALDPPDAHALLDRLVRAASEIRAGRNPLEEGGVVGLVASSEQLATLREAQALMSLLEGHGDVVMSRAAADEVAGAARFARVLAERRSGATGLNRAIQQFLGVEAKLRQYAEGERFVEAVEAAGGEELLARVWEGPDLLPTLEEIRAPDRWVERVRGVAATAR